MKRVFACALPLVLVALVAPTLFADVKTREKVTMKIEGMLGFFLNRALGGSDGTTSTTSIKGNRAAMMADRSGQIIDLAEERIYMIDDMRSKEYRVMTFAEFRKMLEDMKKEMEAQVKEQSKEMSAEDKAAMQEAAKEIEFTADVKETGATKTISGMNTKQVILTVTMHGRGKTVEDSGGMIVTNDMWLAPRVAALDEQAAFFAKYAKALFGSSFNGMDPRNSMRVTAIIPGLAPLFEKLAAERAKLQGTALQSTSVTEFVKSAEEMKKAAASQPAPSSGGGLGGMIGRGLMKGRGGAPQQKSKAFTMTTETLSIGNTVTDADVALPAGFKQKK